MYRIAIVDDDLFIGGHVKDIIEEVWVGSYFRQNTFQRPVSF